MVITEADIKEIRQAAESGDETAKAALAALPRDADPESGKSVPEEKTKVGTEAGSSVSTAKPAETQETRTTVDQAQEKPEPRQRERLHPAVRRIERDKRDLQRRVDEQSRQIQELLARFEEAKTPKPVESEADDLNRLLANPRGYLDERDKRIIEMARKQMSDENRRQLEETAKRTLESQNALKTLSEIEGYDDNRDAKQMVEITAKYLNDVEDTDQYDAEEVVQMFKENPGRLARIMKRAWGKAHALSDSAKADKRAATATSTETGKPSGGKTPTPESLNAELAQAMSRGDKKAQDEIMGKIAEFLGEKK